MHFGFHEHYYSKGKQVKLPGRFRKIIDILVYLVAIFGVVANIPQLLRLWIDKNNSGVSLVSWICFLVISIFWFIYGILHKEKPIILANFLLIIIQSLIITGIIIH